MKPLNLLITATLSSILLANTSFAAVDDHLSFTLTNWTKKDFVLTATVGNYCTGELKAKRNQSDSTELYLLQTMCGTNLANCPVKIYADPSCGTANGPFVTSFNMDVREGITIDKSSVVTSDNYSVVINNLARAVVVLDRN